MVLKYTEYRVFHAYLLYLILEWGGYVSENTKPFILLVGSFRPEQVTEILDGFLNTVTSFCFFQSLCLFITSSLGKH